MIYKVALHASEEGFSARCLGLPGCWSQGSTKAEALENARHAIREYLDGIELVPGGDVYEVEVAV